MVLDIGSNRAQGMLCPHCRVTLAMSTRANIEIDYCPTCRGVWLDRGELDKIIERALAEAPPLETPTPEPQPIEDRRRRADEDDDDDDDDDRRYKRRRKKRRKSWLEEIFDELT